MNKTVEKKVILWSKRPGNDEKYGVAGGELLRHIGSEMIFAEFTREDAEHNWETAMTTTKINFVGDYDPMTQTYKVKHLTKEGKAVEDRVMSAGFKFGNPEELNYTSRLIPFSLHYKVQEEELYYQRLRSLYDSEKGVLGIDPLQQLSSKNAREDLKHTLWIALVIDTDTEEGIKEGILTSRITEIVDITRRSKSWSLYVRDEKGDLIIIDRLREEDGTWVCRNFSYGGVVLGDLKILDIQNLPEEDE